VTAVCWVPRGKCKAHPVVNAEDEDEMREAHEQLMGGASSSDGAKVSTDGLEEFELDNYDDDENDGGMQFFSVLKADGELARHGDPHMTGDPESDSDDDDYHEIKPEDYLFVAVSCEEETCSLEMYVYDEDEANMYVHHDIMLDAYPLCVDWLPKISGVDAGSFTAIGLIDHSIQIWDLDRLDPMTPTQTLGSAPKEKGKLKKKKAKSKAGAKPLAHDGPVLAIHGSTFNRSVLASGSGDNTVKIWDVCENACVHTYTHHSSKVQCVKWHTTEQAIMLSSSFDRRLALMDVRQPDQVATTELAGEAEAAVWSQHNAFECLASADNGSVVCYDVRKVANKAPGSEQVLWNLMAHDVACTGVQDSPARNMLITSSLDGHAKIWNMAGGEPKLVLAKNLQAGPLFACTSSAEAPGLVSFGGNVPVVWDLTSEQLLVDVFDLGASKGS